MVSNWGSLRGQTDKVDEMSGYYRTMSAPK